MMRLGYERLGDRKFDVEALIRVGEGFIVIDHPGTDLLLSGAPEVRFDVEGDGPLGPIEMNVPAIGKLVGEIFVDSEPGQPETRAFKARLAPKPPPLTEEDIMRIMSERKKSSASDSGAQG